MKGPRAWLAASPAVLVLALSLIPPLVLGRFRGLFFTLSRFALVTSILVAPILILPKLMALAGNLARKERLFGQLVRGANAGPDLGKIAIWVLRPLQGIGLSLIFAERFLSLLESSIGASRGMLVLLALYVIGSALVSLLLSVVWGLDDLGIRIYNGKTGEVRTAGSSVGTILPLIAGAIGISDLFHRSSPLDASIDLLRILATLYPPHALFVVCHGEFLRRRRASLLEELPAKVIETRVY
ncbi:MAG: hypothetical protein QXJ15_01860 [Candidatus Bathyarchaeia archaeon]